MPWYIVLLKVLNDLLLIADSGRSAVLVLLDLSSAFDLVDHNILLARLEHMVGIKGNAPRCYDGSYSSSVAPSSYCMPQGSVLGPMLFSLYLLPLGRIKFLSITTLMIFKLTFT